MGKRILLFSMIGASGLGLVALCLVKGAPAKGQNASQQGDTNVGMSSFVRMNNQARAARGGQEVPVRELADSVFIAIGVGTDENGPADELKERVVRAELNYRHGVGKGIPEGNVVRLVNELARKFDAPGYARTGLGEVRKLRMGMFSYLPHLINGQSKRAPQQVGTSISREMSPLEAVYVTTLMLEQKRYNDEYQVTPKERAAKKHNAKGTAASPVSTEARLSVEPASARQKEMADLISRGLSNKTAAELLELTHKSLDVLGVDR